MSSSTFVLQVAEIDAANSVVTFKCFSTSDARKLAVSRFFVLRTLALDGRADLAVCKALGTALDSLSPSERDQRLVDLAFVDQYILKTRIVAIENYIDWETMDQDDVLAKLLPRMKLPSTYQLEVHFSDPAHLVGFKIGPRLHSTQADGWIPGIEALLRTDPENLYTFKNDDEHWRLHDYLVGHNTYGEFEIAWTNAQDSVLARTHGVLPFKDGGRWGAIDRECRPCIANAYEDYDYDEGTLRFWDEERWIPAAELIGKPRPHTPEPPATDLEAVLDAAATLRAAQLEEYGLTLVQLLRCWIRVFSERPDIHVVHSSLGEPVDPSDLVALAGLLPAHALALAAECGPLHFCWVFKSDLAEVNDHDLGYNGGRINLVGFTDVTWHRVSAGASVAKFDELQPEGSTFLFHDRDSSPASAGLTFIKLSEHYSQGNVETYLTSGAASAFVWYWPKRDYWEAEAFVAKLATASLPRTTPADEVIAGLRARGLGELEATAVQRWLGPDATLLLPA